MSLELLLYASCDPNNYGLPEVSPLETAVRLKDYDSAHKLLRYKARINQQAQSPW